MKFPYSMLRDFVDTKMDAVEVGDLLTMAGFELEGIEEVEGEPVLDIKVVSNRGDGLSVFGLSREVLAKDPEATPTTLYVDAAARFPAKDANDARASDSAAIEIQTEDCLRFSCRVFKGAPNGQSPEWLQKRVRQMGMRPISLLVDLTNYVMVELGQPMHAYDLDKLGGHRLIVRKARKGEALTTLNGDKHTLRTDQMMICDSDRPVGAAGVMGGADTEIGDGTTNVLLESANFLNTSVRRTRKQMGLATEASYRFERSVDPESTVAALNRFAQLLAQSDGGASAVPGIIDSYPAPATGPTIALRMSRVVKLLGMQVYESEARSYLERLGFKVTGDGEPFQVQVPTWRPDVVREDDLIEEVGRVHGYDKIPDTLPYGHTTLGVVRGKPALVDALREAMVRLGFVQTISHDLRDRHPLDSPNLKPIGPRNPHAPETAFLRTSLLSSLCDAAKRNGSKDVHLFEIGTVFGMGDQGPFQAKRLSTISIGKLSPQEGLHPASEDADFYFGKQVVAEALKSVGVELEFEPSTEDARFHPTRTAIVTDRGARLGYVGQIHPDVAAECGLPASTVMSVIDLDALNPAKTTFRFAPTSRNPAVRRDIAFVVDKSLPYSQIEHALADACGPVLEKQWLFDIYEGKGVPEGQHSLAVALQLRKVGENFTDEEANQVREKAVAALASLGATMRT